VDPMRLEDIMEWTTPTNVQELCRFMVLAIYYRCFIEGFLKIANPITELQKKINKLLWS
jgi:hypothetical protein